MGYQSLKLATTASNNVAMGYRAARSNTTGANNVAIGSKRLYSNTTGAQTEWSVRLQVTRLILGLKTRHLDMTLGSDTKGNHSTALGRSALATQKLYLSY